MYKLNATYYSIATAYIEAKTITSYDSIEEVAVITQNICASYFISKHPLYAMHTPTPKEIVYSLAGEMGELVEMKDVTDLILNHKKRLNNGASLKIEILYYNYLSKRNTSLAIFIITKED